MRSRGVRDYGEKVGITIAPPGLVARYREVFVDPLDGRADVSYRVQKIWAFAADGSPLVVAGGTDDECDRQKTLAPAGYDQNFVDIQEQPEIVSLISGGGWRVKFVYDDGGYNLRPLVGWALKSNGEVIPVQTVGDGVVEELCTEEFVVHPDTYDSEKEEAKPYLPPSSLRERLAGWNNFEECLLHDVRPVDFGFGLDLVMNYVQADGVIRDDVLEAPNLVTLRMLGLDHLSFVGGLTDSMKNDPGGIDWGLTEIARIVQLPVYSGIGIAVEWEGNRRLEARFSELRIIVSEEAKARRQKAQATS